MRPRHRRRHRDGLRWLLIIAIACGLVGACVLNPQPDLPGNNTGTSAGTSASGGTFGIGAGGEPSYSGGKSGNPDVPSAGASEGGANGNGGESAVGGAAGEGGNGGAAASESNGGVGGSP